MNTPIDFEYKARGNKFHALLLNKFDWCKISLDTSQIRVCPFLYIGSYKITSYVEIQKNDLVYLGQDVDLLPEVGFDENTGGVNNIHTMSFK